ncbi:MAG: elongation factor P maturation arginine rhamnosyltransferase EarP [Candidatus Saccharibacteria bacterium]|nr:elongation factor P maturation arginine rhamnosyltransferase EarP [Rhodoferax sp.]
MTTAQPPATTTPLLWDIFCRVIDNFGDLGVCWRLSADLARRGHKVRLWIDDASALQWMAPGALQSEWPGVQVLPWYRSHDAKNLVHLTPADVWVEGFGCEIAPEFIASTAHSMRSADENSTNFPVWVNLEYLSAEDYVERAHALPSPVMQGPAKGHIKYFFYPGFTTGTGGLLREPGLMHAQQRFSNSDAKLRWLAQQGVDWQGEFLVSLFCYEPAPLAALLRQWAAKRSSTRLLVPAGRAAQAVHHALATMVPLAQNSALQITHLPSLSQTDFDQLLCCCDLNFVRGEDSLVRAIWAGKPLVWQIYPQDDDAHHAKLMAFLEVLRAPPSLVQFHKLWNGITALPPQSNGEKLLLTDLVGWRKAVQGLQAALLQTDDLTTQLIGFVQKKR